MLRLTTTLCTMSITLLPSGALGQPDVSDYGFEFVTIGDPGNRDTTFEETSLFDGCPGNYVGGVDYEYRMATTEVTIGQYFDFVVAYLPIYERNTGNVFGFSDFTGRGIRTAFGVASIRAGHSENSAADMSWEYAARYVNWLHNDRVIEEWAFESGVYDTGTFTQNPDGSWNHQPAHNPAARYWIPTRDEWVKAGYWDPNKDGGQGGYWKFQNSSDIEPIPGLLPEDGGERNAGDSDVFPLDVGSFPEVRSPWGMLDMAGGMPENTEAIPSSARQERRLFLGSRYTDVEYGYIFSTDRLGSGTFQSTMISFVGIRLASSVRSPADLNQDWHVNFFDVSMFIERFLAGDLAVDFDGDGGLGIGDVIVFLKMLGL